MTSEVYFITGASRGLGLELCTQLLALPECPIVVAAARNPESSADLQALAKQDPKRLHLVTLDTSTKDSIQAAAAWVDSHVGHVDVLINNAGTCETRLTAWHTTQFDEATRILVTNVVGPVALTAALLPALRKGERKIVAQISSIMGSMTKYSLNVQGAVEKASESGSYGVATPPADPGARAVDAMTGAAVMYRASKAALNMEMMVMARDLAPEGFTVVSLHPGWVATVMGTLAATTLNQIKTGEASPSEGGMQPDLTPTQSVKGMLEVLGRLGPKDSGTFLTWEGTVLPW